MIASSLTTSDSLALRRKRLLYRATHRGMRELDTTYGAWVSALLANESANESSDNSLDEARLTALETLLENTEPDLLDLLWDKIPPKNKQEKELLQALKKFLQTRNA